MSFAGRLRVDALTDAVAVVEDYGTRARDLMAKAASTLAALHESLFPSAELPRTLGDLVEVFRAEEPLAE
jgi:hypothetical protein